MGLIRVLAGLLLVFWIARLIRTAFLKPQGSSRPGATGQQKRGSRFGDRNVEEADYEELP